MSTIARPAPPVVYPESDAVPMPENTLQHHWAAVFKDNLTDICRADGPRPGFVAADNFVYPVEGQPEICTAPDVYVALGRPPGHRSSYRVWEEGGVFPQVVIEIISPSNTAREMNAKRRFYQQHGAREYYMYDPDENTLTVYERDDDRLTEVEEEHGWVSPLLGIRFDTSEAQLLIYHPDGQPFRTYVQEKARADGEKARADAEQARADRLAAKLRALGLDPDAP